MIVVEHDIETMENSDHIIDIGPEAGLNGGKINYERMKFRKYYEEKNSITGKYLSGEKSIRVPNKEEKLEMEDFLEINGATGNNLKNVNLKLPLGAFTCVTSVR